MYKMESLLNRYSKSLSTDIFGHVRGSCYIFAAILSAFVMVAASRVTNGHDWGDDFGLYLHLARNLVVGRPYNDLNTGAQVPPGFPLILAAWSAVFGWVFAHFKLISVVSWAIVASEVFYFGRRTLGSALGLLASLVVLANPFYFVQQQSILSDLPFVAVSTATVVCCHFYFETLRVDVAASTRARHLLFISVLLYAALLVRPAGLPLTAAIGISSAIQALSYRNDIRRAVDCALPALASLLVFLIYSLQFRNSVGVSASHTLTYLVSVAQQGGLTDLLQRRVGEEVANLHYLFLWFPFQWEYIGIVIAAACAGGILFVRRTRNYVLVTFVVVYVGFILATPWQGGPRYFFPVLPMLAVLIVTPLKGIWGLVRSHLSLRVGLNLLAAIVSMAGLLAMTTRVVQTYPDFIHYDGDETNNPSTNELIAWIVDNTAETDQICTFKPRAFMYFTNRATCHLTPDISEPLGPWLELRHARLGVVILRGPSLELVRRLSGDTTVQQVFRNDDYVVFQPRQSESLSRMRDGKEEARSIRPDLDRV